MTKSQMRDLLAKQVSLFIASGNKVTVGKPAVPKRFQSYKPKQEETVEIEVAALPAFLRKKHFGV
jgi:hypothetical protein